MTAIAPLEPKQLCRKTDSSLFDFETTAALDTPDAWLGQNRAIEAVRFGIGIKRAGYNIFAFGPTGAGKHTLVRKFIDEAAANEPVPNDWCYVENFTEPHRPRALSLPAGRGLIFQQDMARLVEDLKVAIPAAFESDDSRARVEAIESEFYQRNEKAFGDLQRRAEAKSITLLRSPMGMAFAPVRDGEVLDNESFQKLPEDEQKTIQADIGALQEELQSLLREIPRWGKEHRDRLRNLNREISQLAVGSPIGELRTKYQDIADVIEFLQMAEKDIIEHATDFAPQRQHQPENPASPDTNAASRLRRYQVNLLQNQAGETAGAPVIYENHPTHGNLLGRVEHLSQFGTLMTDFTLIKPGALHRANGGYLILDARKVLMQPFAWEELKRTIKAQEIRIESIGQAMSLINTVSLEPEPIPLDVKVVLLGDRTLYYMLSALDPEFQDIFKVAVDIEEDVERTPDTTQLFAKFVAGLAKADELKALERQAVARIVDHAARLSGDSERLSCHSEEIADLLRQSDYWAGQNGHDVIMAADVQQSIDAQIRRADRIRERSQDAIRRGTVHIDTTGKRVGQVNGLAVLQIGGFAFGKPSRITASVQLGKGDVIDIERQVELGGPTHSKGVLIQSGFLGGRYAADRPMAFKASLAFEQSYGGVDGDSASSTELYALLSALSEVPIKQSYAVTGSVDQYGRVQAIGGANEKIEGFFDICSQAGLTGSQGVLIPASNVKHLMLRDDVVAAAQAGRFHIYPIETIDQGIEILTGLPAGERDAEGNYPENSINGKVAARLEQLSEAVKRLNDKPGSEDAA